MLRDLLSSRWFQGGLAFFVLVVGGSLLYSWHVHRTTEAEFGKRPQPVVSPLKNKPATNTAPVDFQTEGVMNTPEENTDTPMSDATEAETTDATEFADLADAFLPEDFVSEEETPAEEVPVSPFGFGPFPAVPPDYPNDMTPTWVHNRESMSRDHELMHRVLIKLWNQGDKSVSGAFMGSGLVYPLYPNTAYVEYKDLEMPDGSIRRVIKSANGPLGTTPIMKNGFSVLPNGVKAIDRKDSGINPYNFLDLK